MKNPFDDFFGPDATPWRRNADFEITYDEEGNSIVRPKLGNAVGLSREDSLDTVNLKRHSFYNCGCSDQKMEGGKCGERGCNRISCVDCFGRCKNCSKPICLEHSRFFLYERQGIRVCHSCYGGLTRKRVLRGFGRILLKPFVEENHL